MLDKLTKNKITFLIPSLHIGGAEKVTLLLANELCKRNWAVSILMSKKEGIYLEKLDQRIKIIQLKKGNISKNVFGIARYLKNNDCNYFYSSMTYVNVVAALALSLSKFKDRVLFSEHSNLSSRNLNNQNFINKIITFLAKFFYKKADAIVCVSEGVKKDIDKVIPDIKKSVVIYNPIENFYKDFVHNNDTFRIISMGRIDKEKNFPLLVNAFSILLNKSPEFQNNLEFYILGDGIEKNNLKQLIDQLNLSDKIFLPGFTSEPAELLSSSDLFVLGSNREGFGNVLVEALSCGLPVISTNCPSGPSEILMNGKFGKLVPVNDVESMADAMKDVLNNRNEYSKQTEKSKRIQRAKDFSVEHIVNQYELLFKELNKVNAENGK